MKEYFYELNYSKCSDQFYLKFHAANGITKEIVIPDEDDLRSIIDQAHELLDSNVVKRGHEIFKDYVNYNNGYIDDEEDEP